MNRRELIAGVGLILALIGSAMIGVAADRMLASSDDETDSPPSAVIENAWVAEDGYIVVNIKEDADPDHLAIANGPSVLTSQPVNGLKMAVFAPVSEDRVKLSPLNDSGSGISFPGSVVPDTHPDSSVTPLSPGQYQVLAIEDGERVDSVSVDLPLSATSNYIAEVGE